MSTEVYSIGVPSSDPPTQRSRDQDEVYVKILSKRGVRVSLSCGHIVEVHQAIANMIDNEARIGIAMIPCPDCATALFNVPPHWMAL